MFLFLVVLWFFSLGEGRRERTWLGAGEGQVGIPGAILPSRGTALRIPANPALSLPGEEGDKGARSGPEARVAGGPRDRPGPGLPEEAVESGVWRGPPAGLPGASGTLEPGGRHVEAGQEEAAVKEPGPPGGLWAFGPVPLALRSKHRFGLCGPSAPEASLGKGWWGVVVVGGTGPGPGRPPAPGPARPRSGHRGCLAVGGLRGGPK